MMRALPVVLAGLCALGSAQPDSLADVVAKLDAYVLAYEPELSTLIADEIMVQEARQPGNDLRKRDDNGLPVATRQRRRLTSEVAFIALPENAGWLGFRHVKTVNNQPVAMSNASLTTSLKAPRLDAARELLAASAAHNLGLPRTTNLPNLPLEFLHPRNRKRLLPRWDGEDNVRGLRTARIVFVERMTPTLIRNPNTGSDMPSVIRAWVDPANGRLIRAEVSTFTTGGAKEHENSVRVEFAVDKALGMWVPREMREVFPVVKPGGGTSVATYTNFRRFQTSARIVPQ